MIKLLKNKQLFFSNSFFIIAVVINLLGLNYLYWLVKPDSSQVPLHYNIYFGIDRYGSGLQLYAPFLFSLLLCVVNYYLSYRWVRKNEKIKLYLSIISFIVSIVTFGSCLLLIYYYY